MGKVEEEDGEKLEMAERSCASAGSSPGVAILQGSS
jgi:hypothetical protein